LIDLLTLTVHKNLWTCRKPWVKCWRRFRWRPRLLQQTYSCFFDPVHKLQWFVRHAQFSCCSHKKHATAKSWKIFYCSYADRS